MKTPQVRCSTRIFRLTGRKYRIGDAALGPDAGTEGDAILEVN